MEPFKKTQHAIADLSIRALADWLPDVDVELSGDVVQQWHEALSTPLNACVKYSKAIQSIQKCEPVCYHACEYRDFEALTASCTSLASYKERYLASTTDEKKTFWSYVLSINKSVQTYVNDSVMTVPTRDEIQRDIKARRSRTSGTPSVTNAFKLTVTSHFDAQQRAPPTHFAQYDDKKWQALCDEYIVFVKTSCNDGTFESKCTERDPVVLTFEWPVLDEVRTLWKDVTPLPHEFWSCIQQMNSFAQVQSNIPCDMMKNIEEYAQKLAGDITSGKMSFEDMNLDRLGQDVLSQCSTADMEKLANNMSSLLPSIANLQQSLTKQ